MHRTRPVPGWSAEDGAAVKFAIQSRGVYTRILMRTILRLSALAVALVGLALWFFGGPNLGWTRTTDVREELDPVTGLVGRFPEARFVPGVDFLAASLGLAGALAGGSFFFRKK